MRNFAEFMKNNKESLYNIARNNTKVNAKGRTIIEKNDDWGNEDVWDIMYEGIVADDKKNRHDSCR